MQDTLDDYRQASYLPIKSNLFIWQTHATCNVCKENKLLCMLVRSSAHEVITECNREQTSAKGQLKHELLRCI